MEVKDSAPESDKIIKPINYLPLALIAAFAIFFFPTLQDLYARWIKWDEGLSHGLLVIGVFLVLLVKSLPWPSPQQYIWSHLLVCLITACLSLSWFLFYALNIHILEQLVLLPLLVMVVSACFGIKTAFQHRFLLLLPVFAIPVWDQLNNVLVNLSAFIVGEMVRSIQMPALIDGNSIYIPYGHILIADGCSGLRYFVIALTIGYIIGYLNRYTEKRMLVTLLIAALLGLIANWIRIFLLILIGYQTKMETPLMADHETFGWVIFGLLILPAIYFAPVVKTTSATRAQTSPRHVRIFAPLAALAIGPLCAILLNPQPEVKPWQQLLTEELHATHANVMPVTVLAPRGSHQENGRDTIDATPVTIQINQYQRHTKDEKLVPYISHLYDTDQWTLAETKSLETAPAPLKILRDKNGLRRVAQVQWFITGNYSSATVKSAKLLQIPAMLQGDNRFRIITIQAECEATNCDNAVSALHQLARTLSNKEL